MILSSCFGRYTFPSSYNLTSLLRLLKFVDKLAGCDPDTQEVAKDTVTKENVESGTLLSTILPAWERNGYDLVKWTKNGVDVDPTAEKVTANATYEPVWAAKTYTLSILGKNEDGIDVQLGPEGKMAYGADISTYQNAISRQAKHYTADDKTYLLDGWNKELPATMPAEDLVITSNWVEAIPVTFVVQGEAGYSAAYIWWIQY